MPKFINIIKPSHRQKNKTIELLSRELAWANMRIDELEKKLYRK